MHWLKILPLVLILCLPPSAEAGESRDIVIGDDYFEQEILRIQPGDTVTWRHRGWLEHTVSSDEGMFASGSMKKGDSFRHRFDRAGVFLYFCAFHGAPKGLGMTGIVLVGDASPPAPSPMKRPREEGPVTIRVPQDHPSVQEAVDAAFPRDLVLISEGIYEEAVIVNTPEIVIRGTDRARVILDGEFQRANAFLVASDGVAIENLTARNYVTNGFYWSNVEGYRGSYLTAVRNGDYGLYAIESRFGQFDHIYAAGSPDSGIYIGGCQPCNALVTDSIAEFNALGYSGTNAGGDLIITRSEWNNNLSGIVPNTLDSERFAPQRSALIFDNWVHDNGDVRAPTKPLQYPTLGVGILLAGSVDNVVANNRVQRNSAYGIALVANLDENLWIPAGNRIIGNDIRDSGHSDAAIGFPAGRGNCFSDNTTERWPQVATLLYDCAGLGLGGGSPGVTVERLVLLVRSLGPAFSTADFKTAPHPRSAQQPTMPNAVSAPAVPATEEPSLEVNVPAALRSEERMSRMTNAPLEAAFGLYVYYLPLVLYVTWVSISVWDLARRDMRGPSRGIWLMVVLLLPIIGPAAYLLGGGSSIARGFRWMLVVGASVIYLIIAGGLMLLAI